MSTTPAIEQIEEKAPRVSLPPSEPQHSGYIDALRGIAILGVILVHASILSPQGPFLAVISFTGQRGVQLFYMVSAFTLFLSLDSGRIERFQCSNFFIRRFCRIAPLFYLAIIGNLLLNGRVISLSPYVELSKVEVLSGFLFLHGLSPRTISYVAIGGWSVAVETTFYLLVPFLFSRIKNLGSAISLFLVSAFVLGTISYWFAALPENAHMDSNYFQFLWFPIEFPVFALGIITYMAWKQYVKHASLRKGQSRELSLLLIVASVVLYSACLPFGDKGLYLSSFLFLPLILGLAIHPWSFFVNGFTRFMGKISYSVYLCHFFVLKVVKQILTNFDSWPNQFANSYLNGKPLGLVIAFLLTLAMSLPLCMFTWKFVEQPGIRAGKEWIRRREQRAATLRTQEQ
jgi:peptidoglycan/LPS O-acetylase OafA/YrhL